MSLKGFSNQGKRPPGRGTMDKQGLKKLSRQSKSFMLKFLKNKSIQNEQIYKNYKHFVEKLCVKAKQTYY